MVGQVTLEVLSCCVSSLSCRATCLEGCAVLSVAGLGSMAFVGRQPSGSQWMINYHITVHWLHLMKQTQVAALLTFLNFLLCSLWGLFSKTTLQCFRSASTKRRLFPNSVWHPGKSVEVPYLLSDSCTTHMYIHMQCVLGFSVTSGVWLGLSGRSVDNTFGMVCIYIYIYAKSLYNYINQVPNKYSKFRILARHFYIIA